MTVEQTALPSYSESPQKNDYAKIREVTGVQEKARISKAMECCRSPGGQYDVNDVINMLVSEDAVPSPSNAAIPITVTALAEAEEVAQEQKPTNSQGVIDLTSEGTNPEEIRIAITESLKDTPCSILGGQVTREEQEISRVLEQSLEESKVGTKRKRGDIWFVDPRNPHERKRRNNWPVGLKNVGNTCWFSAVVQSLFHLPFFRYLVLHFKPPADLSKEHTTDRRNLQFMEELRHLFALMGSSKRKYVDPSKAVEILKEAFTCGTTLPASAEASNNQQDVSEFQHKLLDWLEDAYRTDQSRPSSPAHGASGTCNNEESQTRAHNPMVELFYGQYRAEGLNEGKQFSNEETFGQFPLQVNGFREIHQSLEAATAQREIETVSSDVNLKSDQELWFTRLPPVLTFELSRFQFNQQYGRPEKIHNRLEFPEKIYMDRYMEVNRMITRRKREDVKRLREQLQILQAELDKYINYGSGPKRFPLQVVLQYALEFAESPGDRKAAATTEDIEMSSPKIHQSSPAATSFKTPSKIPTATDLAMHSPPKTAKSSPQLMSTSGAPAPSDVTADDLNVLQRCLMKWRKEVERKVECLQEEINQLDRRVKNIYTDKELQKHPYRLHAVLVHEGQAASGHYWAYVYSQVYQKWLKFNDITATEASWIELEKEGVGGYHNTSAYCLVYVDENRKQLLNESGSSGPGQGDGLCGQLPEDLQKYVQEDNAKFEKEIEEWDKEHQRRLQTEKENQALAPHKTVCTVTTTTTTSCSSKPRLRDPLAPRHALLAMDDTCSRITQAAHSDIYQTKGPLAALKENLDENLKRFIALARVMKPTSAVFSRDYRLYNIVVYMLCNGVAPSSLAVRYILLEQIAMATKLDDYSDTGQLRKLAIQELDRTYGRLKEEDEISYKKWHGDYSQFRKVTLMLLQGFHFMQKKLLVEALQYFMRGSDCNANLMTGSGPMKGHPPRLLQYFCRECVLKVNELAANRFEAEESGVESLLLMNNYVLPSLTVLAGSTTEEDKTVLEEVGGRWCSFFNKDDLTNPKLEQLQECISKIYDLPTEIRPVFTSVSGELTDSADLSRRFEEAVKVMEAQGHIGAAYARKT